MLTRDRFKAEGLSVSEDLRFSYDLSKSLGSNGAYAVLINPNLSATNPRENVLISRLQIKIEAACKIRVRFESGGVISSAWINFDDQDKSSRVDAGLSIWFVSQDVVIVDTRLKIDNDNVRFSLHIVEPDVIGGVFILQRFEHNYEIGGPTKNSNLKFHSPSHAGKALDLCKGIGIEIGALHKPLPLDACVLHVDRFPTKSLAKSYRDDPNVPQDQIRQVHVAWNDGDYPFFDENAFDFVVNSHVLEHVFNPGRQIQEWLRIIRPGGVLYMIVPDKNYCFDRRRSVTTVEHLMEEFFDDTKRISLEHYRDFIVNTNGEDGSFRDITESFILNCYQAQSSIHVHTFTPVSLRAFIDELIVHLNAVPIHYEFNGLNMHCALRKLG